MPESFPVYQAVEWQCRFVFDDKRCCGLKIGHEGDHVPALVRPGGVPQPETTPELQTQPPQDAIDAAVSFSKLSPCRSKRGVAIFFDEQVRGGGYNYKPGGLCDGSEACKATCRDEAVHAEQQALLSLGRRSNGCEMLHVKTVDGVLVPSGPPSCVQCSKLALAAGIAAVWLFRGEDGWVRYPANVFHDLSLRAHPGAVEPPAQEPWPKGETEHSLTLLFHRVLEPLEWRKVVNAARKLPFVKALRADAALRSARSTPPPAESFTAEERELVDLYRQNRCGDPACEGARFSAAQSVLRGAKTHREIAEAVDAYMQHRSEVLPATPPPERPQEPKA
jgi:deoxycytidylate deaminase